MGIWSKLQYSTHLLPKVPEMAKSYGSRKKSSFSQKKKNLAENEELRESGMLDMLSNRQRLYAEYDDMDTLYD